VSSRCRMSITLPLPVVAFLKSRLVMVPAQMRFPWRHVHLSLFPLPYSALTTCYNEQRFSRNKPQCWHLRKLRPGRAKMLK
jgi:hypothetical protein